MTKNDRRSHIKTSRKGGDAKRYGPTPPGGGCSSGDMSVAGVFPWENWGWKPRLGSGPQTRAPEPGRGTHITYGCEKWAFCPQGRDRSPQGRDRNPLESRHNLKRPMHILFAATHPGLQGKEGRIDESHVTWTWDLWLWRAEGTATKILVLSHSPIL